MASSRRCPAAGGPVLGVVGRQGEPMAGEEVLQRAGQRPAPFRGSFQQGLRVDGPAVAQEPTEACDHLAGGGGVVAGHEVVREAGQPRRRVAEPGGEVLGPDRDPVRGPGIAGEAEPVALQVRDQAAGPAGGVGAGCPAGVGARPAPAGGLADPAGLAAPRAGLLGCGPPVLDQAQAADLAADPPDFPAAPDAGPRAQDALAGYLVELPGLAAARALVPGRAMGQGIAAAGAMLPARDADRPAAADALADLDRHRLRASDRRHRPAPGGLRPGGRELGRSGYCGPLHRGGVEVE